MVIFATTCPIHECFARLGESEQELLERFGKPIATHLRQLPPGVEKKVDFFKNGIGVSVCLHRGRSVCERYWIVDPKSDKQGKPIDAGNIDTIRALVETNAQDSQWQEIPNADVASGGKANYAWQRHDGRATAMVPSDMPDIVEVRDMTWAKTAAAGAAGF
jgi:hypothetical protein